MSEWHRVSKRKACPVCQKPDWCLLAVDGTAAICQRIDVGAVKRCGEAGWLHRLGRSGDWHRDHGYTARVALPEATKLRDFAQLAERCERAATDEAVMRFAGELGVSFESLRRLHVGYDGKAFTFPMRDAAGRIVGIRRRFPNGRKLAVKGSREGLFIPDAPAGGPDTGQLFIAEGPTDTAAILTVGLYAIGRPSCTGGTAYVVRVASGRHVVIVGDQDAPGKRGAIRLARELRSICLSVQIIIPPPGVKDARAWLEAGATRRDIDLTLRNGPIVRFAEPTRRAVGVSYRETG